MARIALVLVAAALLCLPAAAEAASFSVKNCSAGAIDIAGYDEARELPWNNPTSSTFAHPGQSGVVQCATAACLVAIVYAPPPGVADPQLVRFSPGYSADVCTRGIQDRGSPLTGAGTCGC